MVSTLWSIVDISCMFHKFVKRIDLLIICAFHFERLVSFNCVFKPTPPTAPAVFKLGALLLTWINFNPGMDN